MDWSQCNPESENRGYILNSIIDTGEEIELKWIDKINIDSFLSKIDKEEDIHKISKDIASIVGSEGLIWDSVLWCFSHLPMGEMNMSEL